MDTKDLQIIQKIRKYFPPKPVIWDIGANRGEYTDFVLSLIPDAKMFLFEPNEMWYEVISEKYSHMLNIFVHPFMIGETNGSCDFFYFTNNNDQLSSRYNREVFATLPAAPIRARKPMMAIDKLIDRTTGIDFIKVDTEGAEFDVLSGAFLSMSHKLIKFIQIEYGGTYPDANVTMKKVINYCNALGYRVYSLDEYFIEQTLDNFVEDYHYDNYLITFHDFRLQQ